MLVGWLIGCAGGYGGKGTWGGLLQTSDEGHDLDSNDSNYDSSEVIIHILFSYFWLLL